MSTLPIRLLILGFAMQSSLVAVSCASAERQRAGEQRLQTTLVELEDSRTRVSELEARLREAQASLRAAEASIALHDREQSGTLVADYQALQRQTAQQTAFTDSLHGELGQARDRVASLQEALARTEKELGDTRVQKEQAIAATAALRKSTESLAKPPSVIETRIDGDFEGWEGETIFKLTNGQIWQQFSYAYTYHYAYSPEVLIYRSGAAYKMKVDGVDNTIFVVRLK